MTHDLERAGRSLVAKLCTLAVMLLLCATVVACGGKGGGGSFNVKMVNSAQKKPANVWVFFTVQKGDDPVGGLAAEDFTIYEDGQEVSKFESKQVILNPEMAAVMYTMLLVDMSGSVTESGQADSLVDSAKDFSERVGKHQKVGVYAFDGSEKLHSVTPFTESQGSVAGGLEGLRRFKPKDPSTNLHGAVVEGLRELKAALDKEKKPLKFGTLVVFSDGTDRANRVTRQDMEKEIDEEAYEHYEMYAIGVGAEIEKAHLEDIGRDGTELATDQAKVREAFDKVAGKIEAHMKRFYLLSYCTPSRKGDHEVRIEAHKKGENGGSGSVEYKFNSDGFGPPPECDPNTPPAFDMKATPADGEGKDRDGDKPAKGGKVEVKAGDKK